MQKKIKLIFRLKKVYKQQIYHYSRAFLQSNLQKKVSLQDFRIMKPIYQPEPPFTKQKLPYLSYNHTKKMHNQSLKKLLFNQSQNHQQSYSMNNIGLLPKISQKIKKNNTENKKNSETSLEKNVVRWSDKNGGLKKRQKLQTQGQTSQQLTQIEESFVSLTNKIYNVEEDVKDTMIDFRRKIEQNKLIIKKQIEKKNKENHTSAHRQMSFLKKKRVNSSRLIDNTPQKSHRKSKKTIETPISKSKIEISLRQRSSSRKKNKPEHRKRQKTEMEHQTEKSSEKILPKRQSEGLFTELQVMLDDKMRPQQQKSIKEQKKLRALLSKLSKFKQQKQYSTQSFHEQPHSLSDQILLLESSTDTLSPSSKIKLKRETNYHEWNKIDLSATSEVTYRKSSFQQELRKVAQYTDRNDASLEKYLGMRKELLKLGFQVQLGHCGPRNK